MDPQTIGNLGGWIGGILGGLIGVAGGLFGTWCTIKNTRSPRERAFAVKASIAAWIVVVVFVTALFLIPTWHKHLLWIPYTVLLILGIAAFNGMQHRIRSQESGRAAK